MKVCSIFLALFLIAGAIAVNAQSALSFSQNIYEVTESADKNEIVAHGFIISNNTSDSVKVFWERYDVSTPVGWETAVCDNIDCKYPTVSRAPVAITILADSNSILDVHFFPYDVSGAGTVKVRAWIENDSANTVVSATFNATAEEVSAVQNSIPKNNIRIYPNPAKDYILIKNLPLQQVSTVEIYNIFGRRMISFSQLPLKEDSGAQQFDISTLSKGVYMLRVFDASMNVIYTKSLSKE